MSSSGQRSGAGTESGGPYRILVLLHCAPTRNATHGGGQVMAQLLEALAARHRLALLYIRSFDEGPPDDTLLRRCEIVEEVSWPRLARGSVRQVWRSFGVATAFLRGVPRWAA